MRADISDPNPGTKRPKWDTTSTSTTSTLYVTNCKICPAGVYRGQAKVWGNGIDAPIGWSHTGCAQAVSGDARA